MTVLLLLFAACMLLPFFVSAQTEAELRMTIEAALLSDPTATDLSQAEFDALVDGLVREAQMQDVSAADVERAAADIPDGTEQSAPGSFAALISVGGAAIVLALLYALWRRMEGGQGSVGS